MSDDDRDLPTTNQPLHGEKRPLVTPIVAVVGFVVVFVAVTMLMVYLTRNTS